MIRLFAALPIPPELGEGLQRRQSGLKGARWRPLDAFHITLRFFGEVSEPIAADLDAALSEVRGEGFELHLQGAGAFGERDHMRAVWAGVGESEPLRRLQRACETAARRAGLKPDTHAYRPHVTLAYLKRVEGPEAAAWVQANNLLHSPSWRTDRFGLYSSALGPDGSVYTLEREYALS